MAEYYRVDSRKLTFKEYWHLLPSWKVIVPWLLKILRVPIRLRGGIPFVDSIKDLQLDPTQISASVWEQFNGPLAECQKLGFSQPFYYGINNTLQQVESAAIALLHSSGEATAKIFYCKATNVHPPKEILYVTFTTELHSGRTLVSSSKKPDLNSPPEFLVYRSVGATPSALWQTHRNQLSRLLVKDAIRPLLTPQQLEDSCERIEKRGLKYNIERGAYVRMTPAELEADKNTVAAVAEHKAKGLEHADILEEVDQLQKKTGSWATGAWVLGLSLLAFVGAGAVAWSWDFALILTVIVLLHELGHYAAMRAFNYKNLRMFFIPLLGAAVSGNNYNVKGWKKAVVSLMGPLPGIVLGTLIGSYAILANDRLAGMVATIALLVNGINLLPFLPLDGGWFLNSVLFCRKHWLETAFQIIASLVMAGYGMYGGEWFWIWLGGFMLFISPTSFRLGRIANRLRARGLSAVSEDQRTIPVEAAQAIIQEVKGTMPGLMNHKTMATFTLSVFEKLNAQPPGWLATSVLLVVYGAALAGGLLFISTLFTFRYENTLHDYMEKPMVATLAFHCACEDRGPVHAPAGVNPAKRVAVIGTFESPDAARRLFQTVECKTNAGERAVLFGQSLLLTTFSEDNSRLQLWARLIHDNQGKVTTENQASNQTAMVHLSVSVTRSTSG